MTSQACFQTWQQVLEDPSWVNTPASWRACPLWLDDIQLGYIVPRISSALLGCEAVSFTDDGVRLHAHRDDPDAVSRALLCIHDLLQSLRLIYPKPGEWLDVIDEALAPALSIPDPEIPRHAVVGRAPRALMRPLGLLTQAVRWSMDSDLEHVTLGRRSPQKRVAPNTWDNRAAGLVSLHETPREAMTREASEEAGILVNPEAWRWETTFYTCRSDTFGLLRERTIVWSLPQPEPLLTNHDGEVTAFETVSWSQVWNRYQDGSMMPEAMRALSYTAIKLGLTPG